MSGAHPYRGAGAILTTQHGKEAAIAPALLAAPGLEVRPTEGVDTDALGTFTGEIARPAPPGPTAIRKAKLGIEESGLPRALASEGSFGPHPGAFVVAAGLELIAFVDAERGIEIVESRLSARTNFASRTCSDLDAETEEFLRGVGFPSHAVIARPNAGGGRADLVKGLTDPGRLGRAIARSAGRSEDGRARLETDMRAHLNPTRMAEIATVADALGRRLATLCPDCSAPGFGRLESRRGLPCSSCGTPTDRVAEEVLGCAGCGARRAAPRGDGLEAASPASCPACNP
ncbi:MAG: DUF6671 family protein [Syntrophothermus sp.]